jgi:hypothetical protein
MPDTRTNRVRAGRVLPFSIAPATWDGLSSDIRSLLWVGWSLKLQLDELAHGRRRAGGVDEARRAGLIKPVAPLTPKQSAERQRSAEGRAERLQAAKQAAANKIARLQQQVADEDKFGR